MTIQKMLTSIFISSFAVVLSACAQEPKTADQSGSDAHHDRSVRIVWCPDPPYRSLNCPARDNGDEHLSGNSPEDPGHETKGP
jgi:hypothetical protein